MQNCEGSCETIDRPLRFSSIPTSGKDLNLAESELIPAGQSDEEIASGGGARVAGDGRRRAEPGRALVDRAGGALLDDRGGSGPGGHVRQSHCEVGQPLSCNTADNEVVMPNIACMIIGWMCSLRRFPCNKLYGYSINYSRV